MARNAILRSQVLRRALGNNKLSPALPYNLRSNNSSPFETLIPSKPFSSILSNSTTATCSPFSKLPFLQSRPCSFGFESEEQEPSHFVLIQSENEFNSSLSKVQDESLPAIFYFTAVWCKPCRLISPMLDVLSGKYPHVTTYKIDIDQEGLVSVLSKLDITSVPTIHFFKNGQKAAEVIGADVIRMKNTMEELYKPEDSEEGTDANDV
ncbi:thioredoxin O2, mitochondrial [Alnus glutinosa]|uniref:thioredoxin O2, mitochondrial n=1 Tax=Alnus glutinosa TaxID=3517 RepID=UPI002D770FA6|nr:thioredoxin O2, mitochondrial [Alnus glutinosa]